MSVTRTGEETGPAGADPRTAHLTDPARREPITREGIVHGYTVAIWLAAGIMLLAALVAGLMVTARAPKHGTPADRPVPEPVA